MKLFVIFFSTTFLLTLPLWYYLHKNQFKGHYEALLYQLLSSDKIKLVLRFKYYSLLHEGLNIVYV